MRSRSDQSGIPAGAFFVSTTGSASNPGTEASPWTLTKALQTLTAGQTAVMRAGTYTGSDQTFTNSGTSGNPITLMAYPGETPTLDAEFTVSTDVKTPPIVLDNRNYITFKGLTFTRGRTTNLYITNGGGAGITVTECELVDYVSGDNGGAIYADTGCIDLTITKNLIHGQINGGSGANVGSGVILFNTVNVIIEQNEIHTLIAGIYHKHSFGAGAGYNLTTHLAASGNSRIRYNLIHDVETFIFLTASKYLVEHNLGYAISRYGLRLMEAAGTSFCSTNDLNHNTTIGAGCTIKLTMGDGSAGSGARTTTVRNNLATTISGGVYDSEHRICSIWASDTVDNSSTTLTNNLLNGPTYGTDVCRHLAAFYAPGSLPVAVTQSGNVTGAPTFVNAGANNYRLADGSVGENAAVDGTDMGCNQDLVGIP